MIRKNVTIKKRLTKSWYDGGKEKHFEKLQITTYWLLFIPIYKKIDLLSANI